jgi:hypothetical protein
MYQQAQAVIVTPRDREKGSLSRADGKEETG